jgi:homoaconitase
MRQYLRATGRGPVAAAADAAAEAGFLSSDQGAEYDEVIEVNLSELEPHLNGPFTPDLATPLSKFGPFLQENGYPTTLSAAAIGSCTNSSYEDMSRVTSIAEQAKAAGLASKVPFLITPGSEMIRATIERDGLQGKLEAVGGTVLANACGPCIGQWKRDEKKGEDNAILTSFNRNFKARNDGNLKTMNFLASPEIVTAMAFSGDLNFNPMTDSIETPNGPFKFQPPSGDRLPVSGYIPGNLEFSPSPMPAPQPETEIAISPSSTRLEILEPFGSVFANGSAELPELTCLLRVRGKCTTDHISAAGPWLKYKGHLSNISENTLMTAVNDEGGQINVARDANGEDTIPKVMQKYKARNEPWMLVVDDNCE